MTMLKASTSEESGIPVMRCRISPIPVVPPATRSAGRRKTLAEKALRIFPRQMMRTEEICSFLFAVRFIG